MRSGTASELQAIFDGGAVAGLTDGQLLERFATRGAEEAEPAFTALVARHGPMVFGVCQSMLRNTHDAEDAFQATFLVLALKAGSLWNPELLGPWLHGVAHRTARRLKDKNARRTRHEAEAAMSGPTTAGYADRHEYGPAGRDEVEVLHEEIERLPERYRTAIVLCDLQGLTHEQAARRLGRPVGTISARLSRARERLRRRLSRRGLALPAGVIATALGTTRASAMPAGLVSSTTKLAMTVPAGLMAGVVPASILILTHGVLRSMLVMKLGMISTATLVFGASAAGVVVLAQQARRADTHQGKCPAPNPGPAPPEPPAQINSGEQTPRQTDLIVRSAVNLKRIASAIHAYAEARNWTFPPPAIMGAGGKPLLSWRVVILPYLGENEKALHAQFKLDEPWDGPHNKPLLLKMPKIYAPLDPKPATSDATYYQLFAGEGALFEMGQEIAIRDVWDGTVNTLMAVEAETPVPWTKPADLLYAPGQPLPRLGGQFKDGFVAVTADGATRFIKNSIGKQLLNAMITRKGGEVIRVEDAGEGIRIEVP